MRRILEPQLTDDQKRADQRRDPTDPPKPCALVPVAPKVESEPAPQSARQRLIDKLPAVGKTGRAVAIIGAVTALLHAGQGYLPTIRDLLKDDPPPVIEAKADPKLLEEIAALKTQVAVLSSQVEYLQRIQLGVWKAEGYAIRRPDGVPEPLPIEITPKPRLPRRTALQPAPEIRLPDPVEIRKP